MSSFRPYPACPTVAYRHRMLQFRDSAAATQAQKAIKARPGSPLVPFAPANSQARRTAELLRDEVNTWVNEGGRGDDQET